MDLFRNPMWLVWLAAWLAVAAALVRLAAARRARLTLAFGRPETLARLTPPETEERRTWKTALQLAGVAFLFLALAGPQWGVELVTSEASGIQVLVAVDTSRSMLAEDASPSRIEKAKSEMQAVVDGLKGQRVGIVAFAGKAHLVCPLTTDVDAAKSMLERVEVGMIPQPGTAIGEALALSSRLLGKYPGQKAVVLLSDGEDRRGDPLGEAQAAVKAGVRLYVVGIGTPEGGPIPQRDPQGMITGYLKDKTDQTVITRLAEAPLIRLAAAAQGAYYRASPQETEATAILKHLSELDRSRIQAGSSNQFKNRFRLPLLIGLLLLVAEMLLPERARPAAPPPSSDRRRKPAQLGAKPALLALVAFVTCGCGAPTAVDLWGGNRNYSKGDYDKAAAKYADAAKRAPQDSRPVFNAGAADYKRGQLDEAAEAFTKVAEAPATPKRVAPSSWYNLGNTRFKQEQYAPAAEAYRRCLILDPKDEDCRFNLVQALKAKKNPPPKQDKKDQKQDKKDNKGQPPPPKPRPKSGEMSQEDAERILQAIKEKEKQAMRQQQAQQKAVKPPPEETDW